MNEAGLESVRQILTTEGLGGLIIFGLPNIRYLCGFTGTDGVLFITETKVVFLTDSRYQAQAQEQVSVNKIVCYKNKFSALADELALHATKKVGIDAAVVTVAVFDELKKQADSAIEWRPLNEQLRSLRAVKTTTELESLSAAAMLNKEAFEEVLPLIRPGITERQIALELEFALKRRGGEGNAFDYIVASGPRGALPHGIASNKMLQSGELVTIDFGTWVAGCYSDEPITMAIGEIDRNLRQIFDIVLQAHDLALAAIRPGMKIRELDAVARKYIESRNYGDYFGHGLGHGVGLEVHEYPAISMRSDELLVKGMVITIEPGIYLPGTGGVRIEDTVVVTENGYQALTAIPKQFKQLSVA